VRPDALIAWLRDPSSLLSHTLMPNLGLTAREASDVAAYLVEAELAPVHAAPAPIRLPELQQRVSFSDVMDRVLGKTCRHCHGNPDAALGDGGPGNTGGFGFKPRRLDLSSYSGVASGLLDAQGERHSVFETLADGTPRLVAALLARHDEVAGRPRGDVRGMPLGLPPLPPEEIQLVASWVAQGRPR
jgi:hypothetical protein